MSKIDEDGFILGCSYENYINKTTQEQYQNIIKILLKRLK